MKGLFASKYEHETLSSMIVRVLGMEVEYIGDKLDKIF